MNIARHHLIFDLPCHLTPELAGTIYDYLRTMADNFYVLNKELIHYYDGSKNCQWKRGNDHAEEPPF